MRLADTLDDLLGLIAFLTVSVAVASLSAFLLGIRNDVLVGVVFLLACLLGPTIIGLGPLPLRSSVAYWLHFFTQSSTFTIDERREFNYDEVRGGIVLGRQPRHHQDIQELKTLGVTAMVSMNEDWELFVQDLPAVLEKLSISHLHLQVPDFQGPHQSAIVEAVNFIRRQRAAAGPEGRVFVHCNAGRGRSALIAAAYLLSLDNSEAQDDAEWDAASEVERVVTELRSRRRKVSPNLLRYPISGLSRALRKFAEWQVREVGQEWKETKKQVHDN